MKPTTLQNAAGSRIEPPVSLPSESDAAKPPTAAALPADEPPGTRSRSYGLRVAPNAEFSPDEPIANSSRFVLPIGKAPASSSRCTAVAVYGATKPSRIFDPAVVRVPVTHMLSLRATGTPASGSRSPAATRSSTRRACARMSSGVN